jgi:hypothetical protein
MEDFGRLNVNPQQALQAICLAPRLRAQLVQQVSSFAKNRTLITKAFNSRDSSDLFLTAVDVGFASLLRTGDDQTFRYNEKTLFENLRKYGLYKRSDRFQTPTPIHIGIINALRGISLNSFLSKLQSTLQSLDFTACFVREEEVRGTSRADLERAMETLQNESPHLLLAFFQNEDDEEEWGSYHHYAVGNIALGILGKIGNIPFILAEPLAYADLVVGIDIARQRKERLAGSINATAVARIYFSNGEFLRYVIHDAPLEGETIPKHVLQSLFPAGEFTGKRVVIHRDGYFRGEEKQALKGWAQQIGAQFYVVEVIKTGTPRLYAIQAHEIQQPPKASAFKLSETEAFLVSSLPSVMPLRGHYECGQKRRSVLSTPSTPSFL